MIPLVMGTKQVGGFGRLELHVCPLGLGTCESRCGWAPRRWAGLAVPLHLPLPVPADVHPVHAPLGRMS